MDVKIGYSVSHILMNSTYSISSKTNFSSATNAEALLIEYILWDTLYGVICIPTIVGNTLILMCLIRSRHNWNNIHILIGNLAISDLIVGAVLLPYCIIVDRLNLNSEKYVCLTKASLMVFAIGISCYGLLLVSIDRFFSVCYPLRYHQVLSKTKVIIMLAIGWIHVSVFAFLPISGWNFYDRNWPYRCTVNKVLTPIYLKVMNGIFILLLGVNLSLYIIVVRISIRKSREIHAQQNVVYHYRNNIRELYRVKTMAMVQGLFAVCWFPYVVLAIAMIFSDNPDLEDVNYWTLIPGMLNSCINWVIYGYRNKELRKQLNKHCKCTCNIFKLFA